MSGKTAEELRWTEKDVASRAYEIVGIVKSQMDETLERELEKDPVEVREQVTRLIEEGALEVAL